MATIINNHGNPKGLDSGVSTTIGVVVLLIIIALFFVYSLSTIHDSKVTPQTDNTNINTDSSAGVVSSLPALSS